MVIQYRFTDLSPRENSMKRYYFLLLAILIFCLLAAQAQARDYLQEFEKKVTEFSLENGITFLVVERHQAPVASFVTFIDVGSVNEPQGHTGIAHILEHMAFKGTKTIGTRNWQEEKKLLQEVEKAYNKWLKAKYESEKDEQAIEKLRARFENLREKAKQYVLPNEFAKVMEQNGATDLNAATSKDFTMYQCSLPANRIELWFSLESDRLMNPVFREFYTEKEVILEERRMRVESDPTGSLIEDLQAIAYKAHPYRHPTIGWKSDILATTRADLRAFYNKHYIPQNMTIAIAGDVRPEEIEKLARTYFADFKPRENRPDVITKEPQQEGERNFVHQSPNQPVYVEAYHTVNQENEHAPALQILGDILARGRISRMYSKLVKDEKLARRIHAFNGFPGEKYPALFMVFAVPNKGVGLKDLTKAIHEQLDKVKKEKVSEQELQRAKTRLRADLVRSLRSNLGLARNLAQAKTQQGRWQKVFTYLDRLKAVSLEDVQRVARKYLKPENRTVGRLLNEGN